MAGAIRLLPAISFSLVARPAEHSDKCNYGFGDLQTEKGAMLRAAISTQTHTAWQLFNNLTQFATHDPTLAPEDVRQNKITVDYGQIHLSRFRRGTQLRQQL